MKMTPSAGVSVKPTPDQLREYLRFWTTGVTIVSAKHENISHGMTVNSFTSISLDPPLVMVSLEKVTRTHGLVKAAGAFGVSLLAQEQRDLSNRFAGRASDQTNRFEGVATFSLESGSPLLSEGLAWFDCHVSATYDAGTHTLVIGEVLAAGVPVGDGSGLPLVYFNRNYRKIIDY